MSVQLDGIHQSNEMYKDMFGISNFNMVMEYAPEHRKTLHISYAAEFTVEPSRVNPAEQVLRFLDSSFSNSPYYKQLEERHVEDLEALRKAHDRETKQLHEELKELKKLQKYKAYYDLTKDMECAKSQS